MNEIFEYIKENPIASLSIAGYWAYTSYLLIRCAYLNGKSIEDKLIEEDILSQN